MICPRCSAYMHEGQNFCMSCGYAFNQQPQQYYPQNQPQNYYQPYQQYPQQQYYKPKPRKNLLIIASIVVVISIILAVIGSYFLLVKKDDERILTFKELVDDYDEIDNNFKSFNAGDRFTIKDRIYDIDYFDGGIIIKFESMKYTEYSLTFDGNDSDIEKFKNKYKVGDEIIIKCKVVSIPSYPNYEDVEYYISDIPNLKRPQVIVGEQTPRVTLDLKQPNNDFAVKIASITRKVDINETSWEILDSAGTVLKRGETYYAYEYGTMGIGEGTGAEKTDSKNGYMRSDSGAKLTNAIEYWTTAAPSFASKPGYSILMGSDPDTNRVIAFANNDEAAEPNWKVSAEDQFFIRGPTNVGSGETSQIKIGYQLRLIYDPTGEQMGTITLG